MPRLTISILKNWDRPDLLRQSPGGQGLVGDVRFLVDQPSMPADLVVVLNRVAGATQVCCSPENLWLVLQEPPVGTFDAWHDGLPLFSRIYSSDPKQRTSSHRPCPGFLPWHVNRCYDQLKAMTPPDKPQGLAAVISAKAHLPGHRTRLAFVRRLQSELDFDLFGHGHQPIDDKWDGLAPYRYALAIENFSNTLYWTEKIADCFLAWTMPIYHGCSAIEQYFPSEAMIRIDPDDPDASSIVEDAVNSDRWRRHRDAITHARDLVLERYNLLFWLAAEANELEAGADRRPIDIPAAPKKPAARPPETWTIRGLRARLRRAVG